MEAEEEARQVERVTQGAAGGQDGQPALPLCGSRRRASCVRCVERAMRLAPDDRALKGLESSTPKGARERWTGEEECFYQQRPTFLAR